MSLASNNIPKYKRLNEKILLHNLMIEISNEQFSRISRKLIDKGIVPKQCLKPRIVREQIVEKMKKQNNIGELSDLNIVITDNMYYEYLEKIIFQGCHNSSSKKIYTICNNIINK